MDDNTNIEMAADSSGNDNDNDVDVDEEKWKPVGSAQFVCCNWHSNRIGQAFGSHTLKFKYTLIEYVRIRCNMKRFLRN